MLASNMQCVSRRTSTLIVLVQTSMLLSPRPQCKCIYSRWKNHIIKFAKIVCKLIVSNNSVRVQGYSYEENQVPFNKDWYLSFLLNYLLRWPAFRILAVFCIIEGVEQMKSWKILLIQTLIRFLGPTLRFSFTLK